MAFFGSIKDITMRNDNYRKVIDTSKYSQLVIMSLEPLQEIGFETHTDTDQFIYIVDGLCMAQLEERKIMLFAGDCVMIHSGTRHNIQNADDNAHLKLFTIYSPPEHPRNLIQKTK